MSGNLPTGLDEVILIQIDDRIDEDPVPGRFLMLLFAARSVATPDPGAEEWLCKFQFKIPVFNVTVVGHFPFAVKKQYVVSPCGTTGIISPKSDWRSHMLQVLPGALEPPECSGPGDFAPVACPIFVIGMSDLLLASRRPIPETPTHVLDDLLGVSPLYWSHQSENRGSGNQTENHACIMFKPISLTEGSYLRAQSRGRELDVIPTLGL
ncbi:uncharacterized protein EI90DRAFT_3200221 [Cantharellus anzutake]|uniref:uncharacterized protein n=1 Tax=Cantharellus anzutake TaxID=1750568 RepID=UPI0019033357|nr:uncharacterized protein EI90DRAFT_3200221 [Cantharellus anzutake]KAF8311035.1 hypothetical protein EI90DRAFT_3200221 [Cantharellus anzutake]